MQETLLMTHFLKARTLFVLISFHACLVMAHQNIQVGSEIYDNPKLQLDGCLTDEEIENVNSSFLVTLPKGFKWREHTKCDATSVPYKVYKGFLLLKLGKFSSFDSLPDGNLKGFFKNSSPFDLVKNKSFILKSCEDRRPSRPIAYTEFIDTPIVICLDNGESANSLKFSSTLVHEVHHQNRNDIGHTDCLRNLARGSNNCNNDPNELSAYSLELEYLNLVFKNGLNFSTAIQESSRRYAMLLREQAFNEIDKRDSFESIVLRTHDNRLFVLKRETDYKLIDLSRIVTGRIYDRNFGGALISYDDAKKEFSNLNIYDSGPGYSAPYFDSNNLSDISKRKQLRDALWTITYKSCIIEGENELRYNTSDLTLTPIKLDPTTEYRCVNPLSCQTDSDEISNSIFLQKNDSSVIQIRFQEKSSSKTFAINKFNKCNTQLRYIAKLNDTKVAIDNTGKLLWEQSENNWAPIKQFADFQFNFMSNKIIFEPFYFKFSPKESQ